MAHVCRKILPNHLVFFLKINNNNQGREIFEKQSTKKRANISNSSISKLFASKEPFKKDDVEPRMLVENLALLIVKNRLFLQFVKKLWLKHLMLQLCP